MAGHSVELARQLTDEQRLQLFSVIDDHLTDGIWVVAQDGMTMWTNRAGRDFYNLSPEQTIGVPVHEFERKGVFRPAASLIALREHAPATVIHQTACGRVTLATANPLKNQRGGISMVVVSVTDITNMPLTGETRAIGTRQHRVAAALEYGHHFPCRSGAMQKIVALADRVADAECAVLITGETGVGKTEIAKRVHEKSPRRGKRFVAVDCGALPASLIEAELFGYVAGAFTGSSRRDKPGLVQMADGGTLFLDEISELPLDLQAKLLRLVEEKRVRPLGSTSERPVDFRLIAACNRDLRAAVNAGAFRADLYYRIAVVTIDVPPLRERPDDIMPIADFHLESTGITYGRVLTIAPETIEILENYAWPGNVRELRNLIESVSVLCDGARVETSDLPPHIVTGRSADYSAVAPAHNVRRLKDAVRVFERDLVKKAINQTGSSVAAARLLDISMPTLMRKKRHDG
jgi:transcriptional regulator with PAS, ATPase and Fis domain